MRSVALGLRENAGQFWLLVLINAFVGSMVGLERELLPLIGEQEFGIASKTALLSFIATFGAVKAIANYSAGRLGDAFGRKRVLVLGWLFAIPVPLLIMWAPSWEWIVFANVLLGVNQGLAWSSTVVMKIDLAGARQRGLAMGLNEFAGYLAVAATAFAAGLLAQQFGSRPVPFYLGVVCAVAGLVLTLFLVRDTTAHAHMEAGMQPLSPQVRSGVFADATWRDPALASCSQVGLVNNLNDGVAWGLFPLLFASGHLPGAQATLLIAIYPATWGISQLFTGAASDRYGRRPLIVAGMALQAIALTVIALAASFRVWLTGSVLLGLGTALVYPTLIAAISDVAHPSWRSTAVGVYRFWRDSGYVFGALLAGLIADRLGMRAAILAVAGITLLSAVAAALRMPETKSDQDAPRSRQRSAA
ncbi:MAG TPA: MFS transporter [Longimicrobiales bacterium]